ncbi:hypothetical protein [Bacillus cereus]|uniref:hypothetical protein n=1 Tax=Bacillus cereus TaxID=1396 RepID=UPI0039818572
MKKLFYTDGGRAILGIIIYIIIAASLWLKEVRDLNLYLIIAVIVFLSYLTVTILNGLRNKSMLLIIGVCLLGVLVVTLILGWWDDSRNLNRNFIVAIGMLSMLLAYLDLLNIANINKSVKSFMGVIIIVFVVCFIMLILFFKNMDPYVEGLNSDFLGVLSLVIVLITMGIKVPTNKE